MINRMQMSDEQYISFRTLVMVIAELGILKDKWVINATPKMTMGDNEVMWAYYE